MPECDPSTLVSDARCLSCLSPIQNLEVQTYLLATLAGVSTDPNELIRLSSAFRGTPVGALQWIKTYLLCQLMTGAALACIIAAPTNLTVIEEVDFHTVQFDWVYGANPALGFKIKLGGQAGGPYDITEFDLPPEYRTYAPVLDAGPYWGVIYALDSESCISEPSNEVQFNV